MTTATNWVAYRVNYDSNCNGEELIGYFQTREKAESARMKFVDEGKFESGICCSNKDLVTVEEILIQA